MNEPTNQPRCSHLTHNTFMNNKFITLFVIRFFNVTCNTVDLLIKAYAKFNLLLKFNAWLYRTLGYNIKYVRKTHTFFVLHRINLSSSSLLSFFFSVHSLSLFLSILHLFESFYGFFVHPQNKKSLIPWRQVEIENMQNFAENQTSTLKFINFYTKYRQKVTLNYCQCAMCIST